MSQREIDHAIEAAQKADETPPIRRLYFIKNLYQGDTRTQAGERVGISRSTAQRWAHAWNDGGVEGLRPRFGGGRPPKLLAEQFTELCELLKLVNCGRLRRFTHLLPTATA